MLGDWQRLAQEMPPDTPILFRYDGNKPMELGECFCGRCIFLRFFRVTTSEILVARLAVIVPPTGSIVLGNTYSIACASRLPSTKNYLANHRNTVSSAVTNVFEWGWIEGGGSKPPPYCVVLGIGGKDARDTFGKTAAEGY